jgi:hypothetical protein
MEKESREKIQEASITAGYLARNYLAITKHPFSYEEFSLTMYRVCQRLRVQGIETDVGFNGEIHGDGSNSLDDQLYSHGVADEFGYWQRHFLQWDQQGHGWYLPVEKQGGFIEDLCWVNSSFDRNTQEIVKQTLQKTTTEVHHEAHHKQEIERLKTLH